MKANELLLWLSARREGSWRRFRAAVEELHSGDNDSEDDGITTSGDDDFLLHQRLRLNLECLAHVEFFARECEEGWRVTPPTLAAHPIPGGVRVVLCGARSPALRERLIRAGESLGCETLDPSGVPEVIRFSAADVATLSELAAKVGLNLQPEAPRSILSHIRSCDPPSRRQRQSVFPDGADWRIRRFDTVELRWRTTDRHHAQTARDGVFEFQLYDYWRYFMRCAGGTFEMPRAVALYVHLRHHRGLLRYDSQNHTLRLPGTCRPPRLLDRALTLCSGVPPCFEPATGFLTYSDVPPEIARFAAELLRQPLA